MKLREREQNVEDWSTAGQASQQQATSSCRRTQEPLICRCLSSDTRPSSSPNDPTEPARADTFGMPRCTASGRAEREPKREPRERAPKQDRLSVALFPCVGAKMCVAPPAREKFARPQHKSTKSGTVVRSTVRSVCSKFVVLQHCRCPARSVTRAVVPRLAGRSPEKQGASKERRGRAASL